MMGMNNIEWKFGINEIENMWCEMKAPCSFVWGEK